MSNHITKIILEEMITLSVDIIGWLKKSNLPRSIQDQLTRSVTSIGANYSEAQDASSKKDFLNKIYISKKEASETVYWLKLSQRLVTDKSVATDFEDRAQRFVMMLQKIITSSVNKKLSKDNVTSQVTR
jgi:four helix bundle protein